MPMMTTSELRTYQKNYYRENRERILQQQKKYYLENRERILEQKKYQDDKRQKRAENEKMLENLALADALKNIKLVSLNLILSNI